MAIESERAHAHTKQPPPAHEQNEWANKRIYDNIREQRKLTQREGQRQKEWTVNSWFLFTYIGYLSVLSLLLYFQHDENTGKKNDSINISKKRVQGSQSDSIRFRFMLQRIEQEHRRRVEKAQWKANKRIYTFDLWNIYPIQIKMRWGAWWFLCPENMRPSGNMHQPMKFDEQPQKLNCHQPVGGIDS